MTAVAEGVEQVRLPAEVRRARILGIVYLVLAVVVYFGFAVGTEGDVTFRLGDDLELTVSSAGLATFTGVIFAFLGGIQLTRGFGKRTNVILAVALGLLALTFLGWAAAGQSLSLVGMFQTTVAAAAPIATSSLV